MYKNPHTFLGLFSYGNGTQSGTSSPIHSTSTADHTVIPLAITIKRLSEIYVKKSNEYTAKARFSTLYIFQNDMSKPQFTYLAE